MTGVTPPATPIGEEDGPVRWWFVLGWTGVLVGIPAVVASLSPILPTDNGARQTALVSRAIPPAVEPLAVRNIDPATARDINARVPFSAAPNPAARPFAIGGDVASRERAVDCLAAATWYEAGDDPKGQRAVAQVVINRTRHPAFPKTVCGVVFQGSERTTGCQFTFTCDGAMRRTPAPAAWTRARLIARQALTGAVDRTVGHATHYHTDWVVPYWSDTLDKIVAVDTHLFFRWKGWWGTPAAFRGAVQSQEPVIAALASLSPAHISDDGPALAAMSGLPVIDLGAEGPAVPLNENSIGARFGVGRLTAIDDQGTSLAMVLERRVDPATYEETALSLCKGRPRCRVLGWTRFSDTAATFPVPDAKLATMSYAYLRDTGSNLQRSLWNCAEFPGLPPEKCMKRRAGTTPPAPTVKSAPEVLSVRPVLPPLPNNEAVGAAQPR